MAHLDTPPGKGGIAVIVLEGPAATKTVSRVFRPVRSHAGRGGEVRTGRGGEVAAGEQEAGVLRLGHLIDASGQVVDEAVVHWLGEEPDEDSGASAGDRPAGARPAPGAFVSRAEINIHGGPQVARKALELLAANGATVVGGMNLAANNAAAAPGRPSAAFKAEHPRWGNPAIGREMLDALGLVQSELVLTAVASQWSGGLSKLARETIDALAAGDAARGNPQSAIRNPQSLAASLRAAASGIRAMSRLLHPAEVVLAGPPNAGKSTLANALVGRQVSIVHATPGTTRDWVRELAVIDGVPVWLTDTAGIWEQLLSGADATPAAFVTPAHKAIDAEAMRRARARIAKADLVLLLDAPRDDQLSAHNSATRQAHPSPLQDAGDGLPFDTGLPLGAVVRVWAKCDVARPDAAPGQGEHDVAISAHTGEGMDKLKAAVVRALGLEGLDPFAPMAFTPRQARLLDDAAGAIEAGELAAAGRALERLLSADKQGQSPFISLPGAARRPK
ncbi:MAG: GTPase [Phycisphaerae bacterium]